MSYQEWRSARNHAQRLRTRFLEVSHGRYRALRASATEVRHIDPVGSLCRDLGAPAFRTAVTGNADQLRTASSLVRLATEEHGARAAEVLDDLAASMTKDPALALNLARAAMVLHDTPDTARRIQVDRWRRELDTLGGESRTPPLEPRRRRP